MRKYKLRDLGNLPKVTPMKFPTTPQFKPVIFPLRVFLSVWFRDLLCSSRVPPQTD